MEKKSYKEKLLDPRWQKKRLEVMQRDNFTCQYCGSSTRTLQVHHKKYDKNKEPWEYDNNNLVTLCSRCHENESDCQKDLYEDFVYLKKLFENYGLSSLLLSTILTSIASYIEYIENGDFEFDKKDLCLMYIYNSFIGTSVLSDIKFFLKNVNVPKEEKEKIVKFIPETKNFI